MGLAVDQKRQRLFVADANSHKVFMYNLIYVDGDLAVQRRRHVVLSGLTPHWVAVDEENGAVFCSDERRSMVVEVLGEDIERLTVSGGHSPKPHVLYSLDETSTVGSLSGIAVDG